MSGSKNGVPAKIVLLGEVERAVAGGAAGAASESLRFVRAVGDGFFLLEDGQLAEFVC